MDYILDFGEYISDLGNEKYGEPPYGHAELSSLKMFCDKMNINLEKAIELLKNKDMKFSSTEDSMAIIAKNNNITPQQVYNTIKPNDYTSKDNQTFPDSPSPSFGKKSIKDICKTYNLSMNEVMISLSNAGFVVKENDTVKEIGANNNSNPMAIFEIIKGVAHKNN